MAKLLYDKALEAFLNGDIDWTADQVRKGITMLDHDAMAANEMRQQDIIDRAVQTADRIILDGSDGSVEETNYLTAVVAEQFVRKATQPLRSALLSKEITDRAVKREEPTLVALAVRELDAALSAMPKEGESSAPRLTVAVRRALALMNQSLGEA